MEDGISQENVELCEIETTIVTGFESIAKEEAAEKLGVKTSTARGKLNFKIPVKDVKKVWGAEEAGPTRLSICPFYFNKPSKPFFCFRFLNCSQ